MIVIVDHRILKKWSWVIVAHNLAKWSLMIVAHKKSDRTHHWLLNPHSASLYILESITLHFLLLDINQTFWQKIPRFRYKSWRCLVLYVLSCSIFEMTLKEVEVKWLRHSIIHDRFSWNKNFKKWFNLISRLKYLKYKSFDAIQFLNKLF